MFNLPPEVLCLIFPLLVTGDQLECMTVCRQWYDNIYTPSLFRVIAVHSTEKLDQLIKTVERNSTMGEKVERLTLPWILYPNYDETIFFKLFPNLREFTLLSCNYEQAKLIEPRQNHPWCRNMETLIQIDSDYHAKTLLCSGTCKNLTKIEVNGDGTLRNLIELLANAPALKELDVSDYTVTFQDLELLHGTAPQLKSLMANYVALVSALVPLHIKPVTSLKRFEWLFCDFNTFQDYLELLKYIRKKYTKLKALKTEFATLDPEDANENGDMNVNNTMIDINFQAMHTTAMTSLFKTWGSQLKTLAVSVNFLKEFSPYCVWSILEKSGCQIQTLTLIGLILFSDVERLSKTNQAHCIQTLKINWIVGAENTRFDSKWLSHFTALKELTLGVSSDADDPGSTSTYDLMDFLGSVVLETLRLNNVRLRSSNTTETEVYPLIKELYLWNVKLDKGMDSRIAHMFPNLMRLTLRNCFEDGDLFMLPNTNLLYLEVVNAVHGEPCPISVITMDDRQQRLYNTRTITYNFINFSNFSLENILTLPSVSSTPLYKSKNVPIITILCNSVYHFTMTNSKE